MGSFENDWTDTFGVVTDTLELLIYMECVVFRMVQ